MTKIEILKELSEMLVRYKQIERIEKDEEGYLIKTGPFIDAGRKCEALQKAMIMVDLHYEK